MHPKILKKPFPPPERMISDNHVAELRLSPYFNALYYGWYVLGFRALRKSLGFRIAWMTSREIPEVCRREDFFYFCLKTREKTLNGIIDANDRGTIPFQILSVADMVFKVNVSEKFLGALQAGSEKKVTVIGPSFGVRALYPFDMMMVFLRSLGIAEMRKDNPREYIANFYRQLRHRLPLSTYEKRDPEDGPLFFAGTYWKKEPETNRMRAEIIRTCRRTLGNAFEGGFAPRPEAEREYPDLVMSVRYPLNTYLEKVRRSPFVFSTPAVLGCIGWKLAEFLAMGKAVISFPINNIVSPPLEHGTHVHFVKQDCSDLEDAIVRIKGDADYRSRLQEGGRRYYAENLAPHSVCGKILGDCREELCND